MRRAPRADYIAKARTIWFMLNSSGALTQEEISQRTGLSRPTVARMLNDLWRYFERLPDGTYKTRKRIPRNVRDIERGQRMHVYQELELIAKRVRDSIENGYADEYYKVLTTGNYDKQDFAEGILNGTTTHIHTIAAMLIAIKRERENNE